MLYSMSSSRLERLASCINIRVSILETQLPFLFHHLFVFQNFSSTWRSKVADCGMVI